MQLILEDGVSREFVDWVEGAFKVKGLSTHSMFLHARMPKNQVIQRQAAEGVHAVVELDVRVERTGKIPMQAFDRSSGGANVRFDQYVDLDPSIAAQVILRTKASSVGPIGYTQPPPATTYGYPQAYGAPSAAVPYGQPAYPIQQPQQPQQPQQQQQEIAALLSSVDPATLQQVLSSLQPQQHPLQLQTTLQPQPGLAGMPPSMPGGGPQPDIQALLSTLGVPASAPSAPAPMPGAPAQYPGAPYAAQPPLHPHHQHAQPPPSGDAAQVQNIMAQLARYR